MSLFDQILNQTGGMVLQNFGANVVEGLTGTRPNMHTQNKGLSMSNDIFGINSSSFDFGGDNPFGYGSCYGGGGYNPFGYGTCYGRSSSNQNVFNQILNQTGGMVLQNFGANVVEGLTGTRPNMYTQNKGLSMSNDIFGINSSSTTNGFYGGGVCGGGYARRLPPAHCPNNVNPMTIMAMKQSINAYADPFNLAPVQFVPWN